MELTDAQKITLIDVVGWDTISRIVPQRDYANALGLFSQADVRRRLGCTRYWLASSIEEGLIPAPTRTILKKTYFTEQEVKVIDNVWQSLSSEEKENAV